MSGGDRLTRALCETLRLRVYAAETLHSAREITACHDTTPNATLALARTVTAAALLSATLKTDSAQNVTVKFSGGGPLREVHVQADATGHVRGYAADPRPDETEPIGEISFSRAIGPGLLTVVKDLGLREPYRSVTPLLKGDVAGDIAYYLTLSEQVPSAVILGVTLDTTGGIESAGGLLIQTLPDTPAESIDRIEAAIGAREISLGAHLAGGGPIMEYARGIIAPDPLETLGESPLHAACRCGMDVVIKSLFALSREELQDMLHKDGGAEATCAFCRKVYRLSGEDLERIIEEKEKTPAG